MPTTTDRSGEQDLAVLQAMPLPGQLLQTGRTESEDVEEAVALSLLEEAGGGSPAPPQSGISFAHMTRMGYAATGNHACRNPQDRVLPSALYKC